ncbi:MAG: heme ABC exporter ATP-binding protein CcmA [Candidatus Methylomirabilia bacterium]
MEAFRPSLLTIAGLRKSFGTTPVLDEVSLELGSGTCLVLLGANGAGKTTLLKIVATLLRPSRGAVSVARHDVLREREKVRAHVGLLAHGSYIYEDLTALENLHFWATLAGFDAGPERLRSVLARVELDQVADERARSFSAGMKRRLALGRVLLGEPSLLLLDEPFDGLDQRGKKWLEEFLLAFKEGGGATVLATHSFGRGLGVADRVAILAGGRIVLDRAREGLDVDELHRLYALYTEDAG